MRDEIKTDGSSRLTHRATGEWYRTPAGRAQRYEPAPGDDTHWYLAEKDGGWHAFRTADVRPDKRRKAGR